MDDDEGAFSPEEVKAVVTKVCNNCLLNQAFSHVKVPVWVSTIVENILKELAVANVDAAKNGHAKFKYVVTVTLQQKTGAAMTMASAQYWDKANDGMCYVRWENTEIQALATVYGVMI
uniref:Dynein light chain n=1 Tax=Haptolina ericina TaxID=156174 RepID=A0A7S3BFB5_9EUKA